MKQSKPYGDEKQQEDSGNALDHSAMGEDLRHLSDVFVYVQLSSVTLRQCRVSDMCGECHLPAIRGVVCVIKIREPPPLV